MGEIERATGSLIEKAGAGDFYAFLVAVIVALCLFVFYLIKRNDSLVQEMMKAFTENTQVIAEFKEMVRDSLNK